MFFFSSKKDSSHNTNNYRVTTFLSKISFALFEKGRSASKMCVYFVTITNSSAIAVQKIFPYLSRCLERLIVSLLALIVLLLLGQDHQQTAEDSDHVVEQIQRVGDAIVASEAVLLHDHLGVEQDESAHHGQADVQVELWKE